MAGRNTVVYSATYSNVPVFEFNIAGNHVMRRRMDNWINATHILKVADYDKPARTRILEREVQKGVHEKVQGGYGKYQGTWIPLGDGRELAAKNGVLDKLMPIFDFVPGDRSPPPAPKHATAASSKPRVPRAAAPARKAAAAASNTYAHAPDYDQMDTSIQESEIADNETVASESQIDDEMSYYTQPRKRRRVEDQLSQADREHQLWADELLDYFVFQDEPDQTPPTAPIPPANANLDRPIDERGHTALHWAAAMGDIEVVKDLIRRGANIDVQAKNGETPLMRSVIFTNNFDRRNMEKLAGLLIRTVNMQEWSGSTAFHHIAGITASRKKYECARYYMDCILNKMPEVLPLDEIERILNQVDENGDTAITIAARHGARKCVRSLIGRNAALSIPNNMGETADQFIVQLNSRRQERHMNRQLSSSPFQADGSYHQSTVGGAVQAPNGRALFDPLSSHHSLNGLHNGLSGTDGDTYKSESALMLTSSIMPMLFTKAKSLAASIDAEIAEKDAELAEAERVAAIRRQEIEALRRQHDELLIREAQQMNGAASSDERLVQELAQLESECKALTEEEQSRALKELFEAEDRKMAPLPDFKTADPEAVLREKLVLARQVIELQRQRKVLIQQIVAALGVAGFGDKQDGYKRLITGALGVKEEDVEGMLPEIVAELEEARGLETLGA